MLNKLGVQSVNELLEPTQIGGPIEIFLNSISDPTLADSVTDILSNPGTFSQYLSGKKSPSKTRQGKNPVLATIEKALPGTMQVFEEGPWNFVRILEANTLAGGRELLESGLKALFQTFSIQLASYPARTDENIGPYNWNALSISLHGQNEHERLARLHDIIQTLKYELFEHPQALKTGLLLLEFSHNYLIAKYNSDYSKLSKSFIREEREPETEPSLMYFENHYGIPKDWWIKNETINNARFKALANSKPMSEASIQDFLSWISPSDENDERYFALQSNYLLANLLDTRKSKDEKQKRKGGSNGGNS